MPTPKKAKAKTAPKDSAEKEKTTKVEPGCLCLADSYFCVTSSWLVAVSRCIGQEEVHS